jgi:hypothetical protein
MIVEQTYCGRAVKRIFGAGSKSERPAVMLEMADGKSYVLRRNGVFAFVDPELDKLAGRRICCTGFVDGHTLTFSSWTEDRT